MSNSRALSVRLGALALSSIPFLSSCSHESPPSDTHANVAAANSASGATAVRGASASNSSSTANANADSPAKIAAARPRVSTPELDRLRTALDRGDREVARALIEHAPEAGDEAPLLRARLEALSPRGTIEALRLVGVARTQDPTNADVYATAAEIYAAHDAFDTAWVEIRRGEEACGSTPELLRARGVTWICRENGAEKGLETLTKARQLDPRLPYCDRALGQAHLLVAKLEQGRKHPDLALAHVIASLQFDPKDVDARRLHSEILASRGDFAGAIAEIAALVGEGEKLEAELASLHKKAGIAALLAKQRPEALEHFAAARAGGLSSEELGSGARILSEESIARTERGVESYQKGRLDECETLFRDALRFDPDALAPKNHLAVVLFQRLKYEEAAVLWREVLVTARNEKLALPEPVHLNLATAQAKAGDIEGACLTLEEYLDREPAGEWTVKTRTLLETLKPKK